MHCKLCSTRIPPGQRACPNCGAESRSVAVDAGASASGRQPLSPPTPGTVPERELSLERPRRRSESAERPSTPTRPTSGGHPEPVGMGGAGLLSLLAAHPEMLEPGLRVYQDERGIAVGANYSTGVGDVDLLATDKRGNLVAILISEKSAREEEIVPGVLRRVGWLRKHLSDGDQQVRAIVLVEEPPASLSYAAAAVASTVSFKTFRVALVFEDLDV